MLKHMLRRYLGPAMAGALVLALWDLTFWLYLRPHTDPLPGVPEGERVAKLLEGAGTRTGAYEYPAVPDRDASLKAWEAYQRAAVTEPWFQVTYVTRPASSRTLTTFALLVLCFMTTSLVVVFMGQTVRVWRFPYGRRYGFFALPGALLALDGTVARWPWWDGPMPDDAMAVMHALIGWLLVAVVLAWLCGPDNPPREEVESDEEDPEAAIERALRD